MSAEDENGGYIPTNTSMLGERLVRIQGVTADLVHGTGTIDGGTGEGGDHVKAVNGAAACVNGGGGTGASEHEASEGVRKENENFTESVKNDGSKVFICNICKDESDQQSKVKRHITMKHIRAPNETPKLKKVREEDVEGGGWSRRA